MPRFAGDDLPATVEGTLVSLADKLDTLVGYFALGRIPTGSQDPLPCAARPRGCADAAAGGYSIPLRELIAAAEQGYTEHSLGEEKPEPWWSFSWRAYG